MLFCLCCILCFPLATVLGNHQAAQGEQDAQCRHRRNLLIQDDDGGNYRNDRHHIDVDAGLDSTDHLDGIVYTSKCKELIDEQD